MTEQSYEDANDDMEERGVSYRKLKTGEEILKGDLLMRTEDGALLALEYSEMGHVVGDAATRAYLYVLRPEPTEGDDMTALKNELEWAWMHLPQIAEDMSEVAAHKRLSQTFTGKELNPHGNTDTGTNQEDDE